MGPLSLLLSPFAFKLADRVGFEPTIPCLKGRCLDRAWLPIGKGKRGAEAGRSTSRGNTVFSCKTGVYAFPKLSFPLSRVWFGKTAIIFETRK